MSPLTITESMNLRQVEDALDERENQLQRHLAILADAADVLRFHEQHTLSAAVFNAIRSLSDEPVLVPAGIRSREPVDHDKAKWAAMEQRQAVERACTRHGEAAELLERPECGTSLDAICGKYPQVREIVQVARDVANGIGREGELFQSYGQLSTAGRYLLWAGSLRKVCGV